MNVPTPNQKKAVESSGNLLIVAGAGAGKTRTLVQRCVSFLLDEKNPGSLEQLLVVTFTEAAAAEMRRRIRETLQQKFEVEPENAHLAEQLALLDGARICTLHSFCFQLVREHFYELELDPRINLLPEEHAKLLARDVLDALMKDIYEGKSALAEPVQQLISDHGRGWDKPIRDIVQRMHAYTQTLPDPAAWFAAQLAQLQEPKPLQWEQWFSEYLGVWKNGWLPLLRDQKKENIAAQNCCAALERLADNVNRSAAFPILQEILANDTDANWSGRKKTVFREPIAKLFEETEFLHALCDESKGIDPLEEDWNWSKPQTRALLQLAEEFSKNFARAKREIGGVDFHDLEQFALKLLWNTSTQKPTDTAHLWREKLRLILVDEYQDINRAQDTLLTALGRENSAANRFLVGDVKQSIYRFRLANPHIFLNYEKKWKAAAFSQVIPLADNFRSHEGILNFVNPLFAALMKKEIGGVEYDADAVLQFGNRAGRVPLTVTKDSEPRVELHLRATGKSEEESDSEFDALSKMEKEARLIGLRLLELKNQKLPIWKGEKQEPVQWDDMVILLRSPRNKSEAFAKEFHNLGIPLSTPRGGFYESLEVADVLNLLRLLDNPLQDSPALAVLRSPFVGLSLDELAEIRLAHRQGKIWTALLRWRELNANVGGKFFSKVEKFLDQFHRWRESKKQWSLSRLTETILDETHYPDWLEAQERGGQRRANLEQLLNLMRQFDSLQGQGLFRFIRLVESQQEAEIDLEPASAESGDTVRLMSIHQSKGQEFPVVVVGDLGKSFNFSDARGKVILDEIYGLSAQVMPPGTRQTYPSLPYWLSQRRQKMETLGEELRLLYVALTRAAERLILFGAASKKTISEKWQKIAEQGLTLQNIGSGKSFLDWIGPWLTQKNSLAESGENSLLRWTIYEENDSGISAQNSDSPSPTTHQTAPTSSEVLAQLKSKLESAYPFLPATREPAKTSVSALRRRANDLEEEAAPFFNFRAPDEFKISAGKLSAGEIGSAHHIFLELVALDKLGTEADLKKEAARIRDAGRLSPAEISALDFDAIASFWKSEVGRKILEKAQWIYREHPFTSRFDGEKLRGTWSAESSTALVGEFVVLQGVIDIAVILPNEIWLLDFKTDRVKAGELTARIKHYEPQVTLYAEALQKIYGRPVTNRWLHFFNADETVSIS
ncbi:MAG: helicase-exonuclease AddAB subunit AddA [Verrucomicrobiota bacterium]